MAERIKLLILVKTYPLPSTKYQEVVCTVGVREDGRLIRLYPIDYRHRPYGQWYKKYQWVEVQVEKHLNDPRSESFRPIGEIRPLGPPLGTEANWAKRKKYVLARGVSMMCNLQRKPQEEISLGIVKPRLVEDFLIEPVDRNWKPQSVAQMNQLNLFGPGRKPLEKIPYKFSYRFKCEETNCKGHKMMIEDWEVCQLYRVMRDRLQDEQKACQKVREKFFDEICSTKRDTHLFVGTVLEHGTWIVLGTFWPRKEESA